MANIPYPQVPQQNNPIGDFFKDPANLATGLVFLAALAQPRAPGQSSAGAFGERAVGALGVRGGISKGLKQQRAEEEERGAKRLEESRKYELQQRQVRAQEAGVELEGKQLTQAERLAREQMASAERLKGIATPDTPAQAALLEAQAGYYNRMPKAGGGAGEGGLAELQMKLLEDMGRIRWEEEVKAATLENRQPDPTKIVADLINTAVDMNRVFGAGLNVRRNPDGSYVNVIEGEPKPGQQTTPTTTAPTPITPAPETIADVEARGAREKRTKAVSRQGPSPAVQVQAQMIAQLQGKSDEEIFEIVKTTNAQDIKKAGRLVLQQRAQKRRAEMSMQPGMR